MAYMYGFDGENISEDEWSALFHLPERIVAKTEIRVGNHDLFISTVWIGISWMSESEPLIYETMVFYDGSWDDAWSRRDATREEAKKTHDWIVDALVSGRLVLPGPEFSDDEVL